MFEFDYLLCTDGGAKANGSSESVGHGSFCLEARTGQKEIIRIDLGHGVTNNEAEYRSLIAALEDLQRRIRRAGRAPSDFSVLLHTDSQLIVGQLTQGWKVKAANLRPLVNQAKQGMQAFGRCDLVKVPRDQMVRVLGH